MHVQPRLQDVPIARAEVVGQAHFVMGAIRGELVLPHQLIPHLVERSLHILQRPIEHLYMTERQCILLDDLSDSTLFQRLFEVHDEAVDASCAGKNPLQFFGGIADKSDKFCDLLIALAAGAGDCDDGCDQADRVHQPRVGEAAGGEKSGDVIGTCLSGSGLVPRRGPAADYGSAKRLANNVAKDHCTRQL